MVGLVWFGLWMNSGRTGSVTCVRILVGLVWSLVDESWLDRFGHLWKNSGWTGGWSLVDESWLDRFGHLWKNSGWTGGRSLVDESWLDWVWSLVDEFWLD